MVISHTGVEFNFMAGFRSQNTHLSFIHSVYFHSAASSPQATGNYEL